jgi:hypothetical protein
MTRIKIAVSLLGVLALASAGCQRGPQFAPVEGTITKAGKPLAGVIVEFHPDADTPGPRSSSAPTDDVGHYRLYGTRHGEDGAIMGMHRVCILDTHDRGRGVSLTLVGRLTKEAANSEEVQKAERQFKQLVSSSPRVPPCYGRPNETPLRVEVYPDPQVIDLEVK